MVFVAALVGDTLYPAVITPRVSDEHADIDCLPTVKLPKSFASPNVASVTNSHKSV